MIAKKGKSASKQNKKNKKIANDFENVSDLTKKEIIDKYLRFRYHIYGINFYSYWNQRHEDSNAKECIITLQRYILDLYHDLFEGIK